MNTRLALAAAALFTAGLALPAATALPAAQSTSVAPTALPAVAVLAPVDGQTTKTYSVPTRHGTLFLEVVHPTLRGEIVRAHGVLTLSPYSVLGRNRDAKDYVPRGYTRMYADVVGTGNSGGCYDYGGKREKESAFDLVEWVAKQPWSRGKLAMTGGSYDGTTATAAAIGRPKGLATIIPEAAISRWYDYAYSGGMRYFLGNEAAGPQGPGAVTDEGFDTPLAFDFGLAVPPPVDVTSPDWKDRVADSVRVCDELTHTQKGYSPSPHYDAFWVERDYAREASKITIPVLVAHNWGDWNVKQDTALRLFGALTRSPQSKLFIGTRWDGHGRPGGEYAAAKLAWIDRWVGGVRNGIETALPKVTSQTSTSAGPDAFTAGPAVSPLVLSSTGKFGLTTDSVVAAPTAQVSFSVTGTESGALANLVPGASGDRVVFQTAPLTRDVRLFGSPTIKSSMATGRTWTTLTPTILDFDPAARPGSVVAVTRGWLDTRYAGGLEKAVVGDGKAIVTSVVAKPMDYLFKKGHRITLVLATSSLEWTLAKPYDGAACATCASYALQLGKATSVSLPLAGAGDPSTLFAQP